MHEVHHFRKIPALMENPRLFTQYPRMVADIMGICSPSMAALLSPCVRL